ncbi:MAG: biopolymer transporter ExbD [Thermoguttaceae bacterium]|nr:biopolymer transporter ExbD [Thermoguttaceae bacterium]
MKIPVNQRKSSFEMNMTPMIDVIFQLLIFFLCTSNFIQPERLLSTNLSLPGAVQSPDALPPELIDLDEAVIEFHTDGSLYWLIAGVRYDSLESVGATLKALSEMKSDLPVLLDIDPEIPLGNVIDVYDLCRLCGLSKVQFAAETGNFENKSNE